MLNKDYLIKDLPMNFEATDKYAELVKLNKFQWFPTILVKNKRDHLLDLISTLNFYKDIRENSYTMKDYAK